MLNIREDKVEEMRKKVVDYPFEIAVEKIAEALAENMKENNSVC